MTTTRTDFYFVNDNKLIGVRIIGFRDVVFYWGTQPHVFMNNLTKQLEDKTLIIRDSNSIAYTAHGFMEVLNNCTDHNFENVQ